MKPFYTLLLILLSLSIFGQKDFKIIKEGNLKGLERHDEILIPCSYDDVRILGGCDDIYFAVKKQDKWALWIYKKQATDFIFEDVQSYTSYFGGKQVNYPIAIVKEKSGLGIIQINNCKSAPYLIPPQYSEISMLEGNYSSYSAILSAQKSNGRTDVYFAQDEFEHIHKEDSLQNISLLIPVENTDGVAFFIYKQNNKYGYYDENGSMLAPVYDHIEALYTRNGSFSHFLRVRKGKYANLITTETIGLHLLPAGCTEIDVHMESGSSMMVVAYKENNRWFYTENVYSEQEYNGKLFEQKIYSPTLGYDSIYLASVDHIWGSIDGKWALLYDNYFRTPLVFKKPKSAKSRKVKKMMDRVYENPGNGYSMVYQQEDLQIFKHKGKMGFSKDHRFYPAMFDTVYTIGTTQDILFMKQGQWGMYAKGTISKLMYDSIVASPVHPQFYYLWKAGRVSPWNTKDAVYSFELYDRIAFTHPDQIHTYREGNAGACSVGDYNLLPGYDSVSFVTNGKNCLAWGKDSFRVVNEYVTIEEGWYGSYHEGPEELACFYVQNKEGWRIFHNLNFSSLPPFSTLAELENNTYKRYDHWQDSLKQHNIQLSELEKNLYLLAHNKQYQIVFASRKYASYKKQWHYTLTPGWVDAYHTSALANHYIVQKDGNYHICSRNLRGKHTVVQTTFSSIEADTLSNCFTGKTTNGKLGLYASPFDRYKVYLFDSIVSPYEGNSYLRLVYKNGKAGLAYFQPESRGILTPCAYEELKVLSIKEGNYSFLECACKQNGLWGIVKFSRNQKVEEIEKARHETMEQALKAAGK